MNVVETLQKTKELLKERGRTQLVFKNDQGQLCLLGAVAVAALGDEEFEDRLFGSGGLYPVFQEPAIAPVIQEIAHQVEDEIVNGADYTHEVVYGFNDFLGRTDDEVFDLLDRAIEAAA